MIHIVFFHHSQIIIMAILKIDSKSIYNEILKLCTAWNYLEKNVFTKGGEAQMFGLLEKMCEIWLTDDHFCLSMGGHQEAQDLACISLGAQVITV